MIHGIIKKKFQLKSTRKKKRRYTRTYVGSKKNIQGTSV